MSEYDDLPSCPFCGGDELDIQDTFADEWEGEAVECRSCHASAPIEAWRVRAAPVWNGRPDVA